MENQEKISVCIPYYNRADMVMQTISSIYDDERIAEFVLCDDRSPDEDYQKLLKNVEGLKKVKVYRNLANIHVQHNKRNALYFASSDWIILVDNDNMIDKSYIDRLYDFAPEWKPGVIYHPVFAAPHFNYSKFSGRFLNEFTIAGFADKTLPDYDPIIVTLLNTNNYFVNRKEYLKCYQYSADCRGADGIFNAYNWMAAGNDIYVVPDLVYMHRVHDSSAFLAEADNNMKLIFYWLDRIREDFLFA
jgi:glycosyltransferase involved in cell wall biosynthesis